MSYVWTSVYLRVLGRSEGRVMRLIPVPRVFALKDVVAHPAEQQVERGQTRHQTSLTPFGLSILRTKGRKGALV